MSGIQRCAPSQRWEIATSARQSNAVASNCAALGKGTRLALFGRMKYFMLLVLVLVPAATLAGCDEPEDCGNPFGCGDESKRMTSGAVGDLVGVDESTIAVVLDEEGFTPFLSEESDELIYELTASDLDRLAVAAD